MDNKLSQESVNQQNAIFWDELCGTALAKHLEICDRTAASLKKFDDFYFNFYPYLLDYIKPSLLKNKKVLEIGLGYGTLSQRIAESGADYYGLDIAAQAVNMVNHRLRLLNKVEKAQQGNILNAPFENETFDAVFAIGCFHHTGDLQRCIDEAYRILKPSGRLVFMVYNKYSYREWSQNFKKTLKNLLSFTKKNIALPIDDIRYDGNQKNEAPPITTLHSRGELRKMLHAFSSVTLSKENCDPYMQQPREQTLKTIGKYLGLDIYVECIKS